MATKDSVRYQLKVILNHVKPSIWRRIVVPGSLTLWQLHAVLQATMEWQEMHLHIFEIQNTEYGDPANDESGRNKIKDENFFRLSQVIPRQVGFRFNYTYDFGDTWEHALLVEKILPAEGENLPVCLAGSRAGGLEDSGGPFGYMELLDSLQDPDHPNHIDNLEWVGEMFDPEAFDLEDINQRLKLLTQNEYQLEALFGDEDEDEDLDEADQEQMRTFGNWAFNLPDELKQACEELPLRKDVLTLLTYLRDHTVKGTASTGNFPLKAVREITAGFVDPPQLDFEGHKLRSEDEISELFFVHVLALGSELITGGASQRWELTEDGLLFFEFPPHAQTLQLFFTWCVHMRWSMIGFYAEFEDTMTPQGRLALLKRIAEQPAGVWLPFVPFSQQLTTDAGWHWPYVIDAEREHQLVMMGAFAMVIIPLISFGAVEFRRVPGHEDALDHNFSEIRFTPLGKSLLTVVNDLIQAR